MIDSLLLRRISLVKRRGRLGGAKSATFMATGHPGIDQALGGGVMRGRLHELIADPEEAGSGSGFAVMLARLIGGEMLWLIEERAWRQAGPINAAGLAAIGMDPARLIVAVLPNAAMVLRAAVDGLRCPDLGGVIMALWGTPRQFDLTASRRLAMAAEKTGVTALLLRLGGQPLPTAAQTRWRVASAPSAPLAANAPGHPAWHVELLRQRGRPDGGCWRVEWSREQGRLHEGHEADGTALPGAVASAPFDRPADAGEPFRQTG